MKDMINNNELGVARAKTNGIADCILQLFLENDERKEKITFESGGAPPAISEHGADTI